MQKFNLENFRSKFTPATLNIWNKGETNERWVITLYHIDPVSGRRKRWAQKLNRIKDMKQRLKHANNLVHDYNELLRNGWNPFEHGNPLNFKRNNVISHGWELYLKLFTRLVKIGKRSKRTTEAYTTYYNVFNKWLKKRFKQEEIPCFLITKAVVKEFLYYLEDTRKISENTINEYRFFIKTFSDFLIEEDLMTANPTIGIRKKVLPPKKAPVIFSQNEVIMIIEYLEKYYQNFTPIFLMVYLCLMRNKEISALKVSNIMLKEQVIHAEGVFTKNGKDGVVTIPDAMMPYIHRMNLSQYNSFDYLFSKKDFLPGPEPIDSRKITRWFNCWVRDKLKLDKNKTFYKGKHTGATWLLKHIQSENAIVNQARHQSIMMTKNYYQSLDFSANEEIKQNSPPFTRKV